MQLKLEHTGKKISGE